MVIKALAIELYRAQQRVYLLRDRLDAAPVSEKERLRRELDAATAACDQLRRRLESRKEPPPFRTGFTADRKR